MGGYEVALACAAGDAAEDTSSPLVESEASVEGFLDRLGSKMDQFDDWVKQAALRADIAVKSAMNSYRDKLIVDEDDLNGALAGALNSKMQGQIGGLVWSAAVVRHRKGKAALGGTIFIEI